MRNLTGVNRFASGCFDSCKYSCNCYKYSSYNCVYTYQFQIIIEQSKRPLKPSQSSRSN